MRTGGIARDGQLLALARRARPLAVDASWIWRCRAKRIDLSYAGRYETFLGSGEVFTSRIEARWRPMESVTLFANGSDSFRLPPLGQLDEGQNGSVLRPCPDAADPRIGFATRSSSSARTHDSAGNRAELECRPAHRSAARRHASAAELLRRAHPKPDRIHGIHGSVAAGPGARAHRHALPDATAAGGRLRAHALLRASQEARTARRR